MCVEIGKKHGSTAVGTLSFALWLQRRGVKQISAMKKVDADRRGCEDHHGARGAFLRNSAWRSDYLRRRGVRLCSRIFECVIDHVGETNVLSDMAIIHDLYAPNIVMLPIGDHFTMSPREAAYACKLLKPM